MPTTNLNSQKICVILIKEKILFTTFDDSLNKKLFLRQYRINNYLYNSIMSQSRLARNLFKSNKKPSSMQNEYDCHYCSIKQKFSGPDQKCLEHTITDNKSEASVSQVVQDEIIQHILQLLLDVEDSLEEYWNNLHDYSQGSSQKVKEQLRLVNQAVKRIQQKLAKFPLEQSRDIQQLQLKRFHHEQQQKKMGTRSQRFLTSNFSQLFDDISTHDIVKQWVIYFQKIIVSKQIQEEILPLEKDVDMQIFKESMERKFIAFARNYDRYQRRITQALERLLFYMQNFGSELSEDMLSKDLLFIQESDLAGKANQTQELYRNIFIQALTIQHLLVQKQLQVEYQQTYNYNN